MNVAKMQHSYLRRAKNRDILTACHRNNAMLELWFGIVDTLCSACGPPSTSAVFFLLGLFWRILPRVLHFVNMLCLKCFKTQHIVDLLKSTYVAIPLNIVATFSLYEGNSYSLMHFHLGCLIFNILINSCGYSTPENLYIKFMIL